jgi:hypothetical protein
MHTVKNENVQVRKPLKKICREPYGSGYRRKWGTQCTIKTSEANRDPKSANLNSRVAASFCDSDYANGGPQQRLQLILASWN